MAIRGPIRVHIGRRGTLALLLAPVLALTFAAHPALASRKITVEQLRQLLTSAAAEHRADLAVARQLDDVKLTFRLGNAALQKLIAASPGPKTTQALRYLADTSILLAPPADEIPPLPAPDLAAQKAMIARTVHYVARTLPALPNLLATRVTRQLVDARQSLNGRDGELLGGLYLVNVMRNPIAFRDGQETEDPSREPEKATAQPAVMKQVQLQDNSAPETAIGLTSRGEFGPILGVILVDSVKGKISWARWESSDGKPVAVFQFAVARSASHFSTNFQGSSQGPALGYAPGKGLGSRSGRPQIAGPLEDEPETLKPRFVGYHGLLSIDPETGSALRLTIEMDWHPGDTLQRPAMMVEYGPVQMGDTTYICPVHSVAMSVMQDEYQLTPTNPALTVNALHLNDVEFTEYRRFGSASTLLAISPETFNSPGRPSAGSAQNPGHAEAGNAASETAAAGPPPATAPATANPAPSPGTELASVTPPASPVATVPLPAPPTAPATLPVPPRAASAAVESGESDEEILIREVNGLSGMDASAVLSPGPTPKSGLDSAKGGPGNFTLQVASRWVDLDLVATDKHGKPIPDLKPEEIEVYDNGRKQHLSVFRRAIAGPGQSPQRAGIFTNAESAAGNGQAGPDLLILLLDEAHVARPDLLRARAQVLGFLNAAPPDSQVAVYTIGERGLEAVQDVTQDHASILSSLGTWVPSAHAGSQTDRRNRQQPDPNAASSSAVPALTGLDASGSELLGIGANPLGPALESMTALARHFSAVPGHKSLALISGDSALAALDGPGADKEGAHLEAALTRTREALNESHIALYVVDASAASVGAVDAMQQERDLSFDPTSGANSDPRHNASTVAAVGNEASRTKTDLIQNSRSIDPQVRQLAEATGGRAVNKGADLRATLQSIDQDRTAIYQVGFGPDTPADGKLHNLQVKLPGRKDVKLRYRSSYLYGEVAASLPERFQEALWSPRDAGDIPITAEVVSDRFSANSTVKLRVAFSGVSLEKNDEKNPRWTGQLYVFLVQRDDARQKAEVSSNTIRLSLKQSTYESGMPAGIPYQHELSAKYNLGSIRILVVDGNSGKMGSVTLPSSALHP